MVWGFSVLNGINLEVKAKEKLLFADLLFRQVNINWCINRLEEHQEGDIIVDGITLTEDTKNIEQIRAEVGMVFQQFNLFHIYQF